VICIKNICLYIPKLEDYWYQEKIQSDPQTMSYNAGYDVSYYGYHYDTGCIDFPKDRWENLYNKRINENKYFAYIKDNDTNEFIGYVNYQYNKSEDRYECGILIESIYRGKGYSKQALKLLCDVARNNGIKELYDNFEIDRGSTLDIFKKVGFNVIEKQSWKKFRKDVEGVIVRIEL
jgi:RimJ/RimL family protein N-acetyltransferase